MARIISNTMNNDTHLRGGEGLTLCHVDLGEQTARDGDLTCSKCAEIALTAIELSTKKERKLWREL